MPNNANQKLRLLRLLEILIKETDEKNGLTTNQLLDSLADHDIFAERKSLYRDFKAMREFGLGISQNKEHQWYLEDRPFTSEELTMLADAVQSTPFLTDKMSRRLIRKLRAFASKSEEKKLDRRIRIPAYVKMQNEGVYDHLDAIQEALRLKRKLEFQYFRFDAKKGRNLQKDGRAYTVNPLELIYAGERYYLLTFNERYEGMTPYRVDRMQEVRVSAEPIAKNEKIATWKLDDDVILSFGVFSTKVVPVTLEIDEDRVNILIDKFGHDIDIRSTEDGWARAHVHAPLSPQFFGWLLQSGTHIRIVSPSKAIEEYKQYLRDALSVYGLDG